MKEGKFGALTKDYSLLFVYSLFLEFAGVKNTPSNSAIKTNQSSNYIEIIHSHF